MHRKCVFCPNMCKCCKHNATDVDIKVDIKVLFNVTVVQYQKYYSALLHAGHIVYDNYKLIYYGIQPKDNFPYKLKFK